MKLAELRDLNKHYERVPEVPRGDVMALWSLGHYDGPAKGIAHFRGRKVIAVSLSNLTRFKGGHRRFFLVAIPDAVMKREMEWHVHFQEIVGKQTTWNAWGQHGEALPDTPESADFFKTYCARETGLTDALASGEVLGWFRGWRPTPRAT